MKKMMSLLAVLVGFFYSSCATAQKADSALLRNKQEEWLQVYRKALQYNDMSTAAVSLVSYLNSGGLVSFSDSLAVVYYNMNNFSGSYKLAGEAYARDSRNVAALSLLADISGQTNDAKTSLDWYEKLCPLNPMPYNYYQLASKQFTLERKLECMQSLSKVLADTATAAKQSVTLQIGQGYNETVPVLAAAYNMMGVLALKDNKINEARQYYLQALKIFPEFVIAKQNMDAMNKPAGAVKKPSGAARPKL